GRDPRGGVAGLHPQVLPVHQRQRPTGPEAEPEEERQRGVAEIIADLPADLEIDLLDHIGGVDSALQAAVEPELDHAAQPGAIACEEILQALPMPLTGSPEGLEFARVVGHGRKSHILLLARAARTFTGDWEKTAIGQPPPKPRSA